MSVKKEKILSAAIELFAELGYSATSTIKVAKAAGVSEGLIFRHFGNKEGLLQAIMEQARENAFHAYAPVLSKTNPKDLLRGIIELPFKVDKHDYHVWRLIYALKWQTATYDSSMSDPVRIELNKAFEKLGYEDPNAETEAILIIMDGVATSVLLRKPDNLENVKQAILNKYEL